MRSVVHFEIPADDVARAKEFYRSVFDWQLEDMPGMDYTFARTTEVDENQMPVTPGAVNGGLVPRSSETPTPVLTIDVESIDQALEQVKAAGGQVVRERTEVPGMGAYAYCTDPEGNTLGLWETI
ncbi:MAG TPA: VOC family protein [Pseudonocardia sp.]|jgi:predicted enzyme related to lactoylglutathione lyase|uniref:VOC family protein n=1 Tax=Pseudonocardia sp. TaxID=60912 RepID=UPI002B4ACC30|nr:VOC family protein [Pseudonocardia sp.]HLU60164.1 VOC family protein [Pseudonocardia sp.]